jgi:probable HAF family extracellular repeat protein
VTDDFEERADDVRVLLETAHVPPAHADLARAITAGTVVRRRRRYAAVAAATLFALASTAVVGQALDRTGEGDRMEVPIGETVTSTPAPFSACTVSALPAPAGKGYLTGQVVSDPTGRYAAAGLVQPDGTIRSVRWTDGEPEVLPANGSAAQPRAVNSAGDVVGTSATGDGRPIAWLYRDGRVTRLAPVPGYEWWTPLSVDEHGDVTGEAWRGARFAVVSWPGAAPHESPVLLTRPHDIRGSGVGGGGTVVGTRGDGAVPYAWHSDGTGRLLQLPPGAATGQALAVSGDWAAGWVGLHPETGPPGGAAAPRALGTEQDKRLADMRDTSAGAGKLVTAPARWNLRTGEVTHWPGRTMPATAVNASGWVATPGDGGPTVISPEGEMTTLPGPADGYPTTLSDDNRRLYGERVRQDTEGNAPADALAAKQRVMTGAVTELLMWHC